MRIDLLLTSRRAYTYENYVADRVTPLFQKHNIPYKKIVLCDGVFQDYIRYIFDNPPHHMVSFDSMLSYQAPFCDLVSLPQFMWACNSQSEAVPFVGSKFGKVGLPNPSDLPNTVYLPHGVESIKPQKNQFDVVFFSPLVDLACLKEREVDSLAYEEEYQRADRAFEVISSAQGYTLDVFGSHIGANWYRRLPKGASIHLHAPLAFTGHFDVLSKSKVVILDPLDRAWALHAAAAGCLPLRTDQKDLHAQIALFLADEKKRQKALLGYQEQIEGQTWEKQALHLIEEIYHNAH